MWTLYTYDPLRLYGFVEESNVSKAIATAEHIIHILLEKHLKKNKRNKFPVRWDGRSSTGNLAEDKFFSVRFVACERCEKLSVFFFSFDFWSSRCIFLVASCPCSSQSPHARSVRNPESKVLCFFLQKHNLQYYRAVKLLHVGTPFDRIIYVYDLFFFSSSSAMSKFSSNFIATSRYLKLKSTVSRIYTISLVLVNLRSFRVQSVCPI